MRVQREQDCGGLALADHDWQHARLLLIDQQHVASAIASLGTLSRDGSSRTVTLAADGSAR